MDDRTARPQAPAIPASASRRLLAAFLAGRNPRTLAAYRADVQHFAAFLGAATVEDAARALLAGGQGRANETALRYRAHLQERGLSPATVNRRLAAVRSLVKVARVIGLVPWKLDVEPLKAEPYRDTRGPGREGFRRMLMLLEGRDDARARRARALLSLGYDLALRRGEVGALNVADVDLEAGTVAVLGKGRATKQRMTLPEPTRATLADWLEARGAEPGPLFLNFDRAGKGGRLTPASINRIVHALGRAAGLRVTYHGLRHASITRALDLSGGNVRAVQRHSRHQDVRTVGRYDDERRDLAGEIARKVAEDAREDM
ncbi:MAG: tyrosine-type recombinase/integrase [Deltaproteobacteria bacterium]|nr:tyrosine-type recombinase/integrase [Deltaproteobacteria bacterium]